MANGSQQFSTRDPAPPEPLAPNNGSKRADDALQGVQPQVPPDQSPPSLANKGTGPHAVVLRSAGTTAPSAGADERGPDQGPTVGDPYDERGAAR